MSGNGLVLNDIDLSEDEISQIVEDIKEIEINQLTAEQVKEAFEKWIVDTKYAERKEAFTDLGHLAGFIFVNGNHESINDKIKINATLDWGTLKKKVGFKPSMKSMFLRWCSPIMALMASEHPNDDNNLMFRLAKKYDLLASYDKIPISVRFFGGYYNSTATQDERSSMLSFQKVIIELSSPKSTAVVTTQKARIGN